MANPPITIGPFSTVPAPGSPIKSDWAQQITTYLTNELRNYANTSAMNADTTAPQGCMAVISGNGERYMRYAGGWRPLWPRLVGNVTGSPGGTWGTTDSDISGAFVNVPLYANNRYLINAQIGVNVPQVCIAYLKVTDAANTLIAQSNQTLAANDYTTLSLHAWHVPAATIIYKLRMVVTVGTMTQFAPFWLDVIDYGPI